MQIKTIFDKNYFLQRFLQLKIRSKKYQIDNSFQHTNTNTRYANMKNTEIRFYSHFTHFYFKTTTFYVSSRLLEENTFVSFSNILIHPYTQTSLRVLAHRVVIANELTFKYQCPPVTSFACRQNTNSSIGKTIMLEFKRHRN